MSNRKYIVHPLEPFFPKRASRLILGSFPSVKSREEGFYYGNPLNQFWKILALVFENQLPKTIETKKAFLTKHGIALYDVIEGCSIIGSSDSSIQDEKVSDIPGLIQNTNIERIYCNGKKSFHLFKRFYPLLYADLLPSSSPAFAVMKLEEKVEVWKEKIGNSK